MRHIRALWPILDDCQISTGEIVVLLPRVRNHAKPALEAIIRQHRASPAVHADETRWRENDSIGSPGTPTWHSDEEHHSRSEYIVKEWIRPDDAGVLGSDCDAGSNRHQGFH